MMNTFYDIFFINSIFMTEKYFFWIKFKKFHQQIPKVRHFNSCQIIDKTINDVHWTAWSLWTVLRTGVDSSPDKNTPVNRRRRSKKR